MFYRFMYTVDNLLSKMSIEGSLMSKSRNIALRPYFRFHVVSISFFRLSQETENYRSESSKDNTQSLAQIHFF